MSKRVCLKPYQKKKHQIHLLIAVEEEVECVLILECQKLQPIPILLIKCNMNLVLYLRKNF